MKNTRYRVCVGILAALCLLQSACSSAPVIGTTSGDYTDASGDGLRAYPAVFASGQADVEESTLPAISIDLVSVGDVMSHEGTMNSAEQPDGSFDFTKMFEEVAYCFEGADYVIGNLETTFSGKARGYAGYPCFNTPETMGDALRDVLGMDLLSTANNHSLDCGFDGLVSTLDFLDAQGIAHTGTYREDNECPYYMTEIKGAKVAFLSYTYGSNNPIRNTYSIHINDKESIRAAAQAARDAGAHYIILLDHWGEEYNRGYTDAQKEFATWVFQETEVQLIIGNHAHVVEPIEEITVTHNGQQKKGVVFYALGNFTGAQRYEYSDTGIIVKIRLSVDTGNPNLSSVEDIEYTPTFIDPNDLSTGKRYRVVTIDKVMADYEAGTDTLLDSEEYARIQGYLGAYKEMLEVLPYVHTEDRY